MSRKIVFTCDRCKKEADKVYDVQADSYFSFSWSSLLYHFRKDLCAKCFKDLKAFIQGD